MALSDNLKKKFERFPPLFNNAEIPLDRKIIGDHMFDYAVSIGRTTDVNRSFISSRHTKGLVILTTMFQEYKILGLNFKPNFLYS